MTNNNKSFIGVADRSANACIDGIPAPIVTLNRATIVVAIALAAVSGQTWLIAVLFAIIAPAALFGRRASPIFKLGTAIIPADVLNRAEQEDKRLMRFNNSIAAILLGGSTLAFLVGLPVLGWVFAGMVAAAATVALLGFCVGCFLFLQFNLARYRVFARM